MASIEHFLSLQIARSYHFRLPSLHGLSHLFSVLLLLFLLLSVAFSPLFGECERALHTSQFGVRISAQVLEHADPDLDLFLFVFQLFYLCMVLFHLPSVREVLSDSSRCR